MAQTTVMVADNHPAVRQGLRALLEAAGAFSVVGEAANGFELADRVQRLAPDLLLLDMGLPGLDVFDLTESVHHDLPATQIVLLARRDTPLIRSAAEAHGAAGVISKTAAGTAALDVIRRALVTPSTASA